MSEAAKTVELGLVDFNHKVLNINGDEIKDGEGKALTAGNVACNALLASLEEDKKMDGVQKLKLWNLAKKIQGGDDEEEWSVVKLNSTKKKLILGRVEKCFSTGVYARMYELFEGTTEEDDDD